jgi:hypothetical protein
MFSFEWETEEVWCLSFCQTGSMLAIVAPYLEKIRLLPVDATPTEPAERISLWTAVLTGLTLETSGVVRELSAEEMADRRARLDRAGGPPKAYLDALARRRAVGPTALQP